MGGHGRHAREAWLKRQALQLGGQLPDDVDEARRVIEYMRELVDGFLAPGDRSAPASRQRKFKVVRPDDG